jgi:hypothetical protein
MTLNSSNSTPSPDMDASTSPPSAIIGAGSSATTASNTPTTHDPSITRPCLQVRRYIFLVRVSNFYQFSAEAAALRNASRLIPNQFMVLLKPDVDARAHMAKVQAAMDSTASSDSVKSRFTSTRLLVRAGFYGATLSPAMEAFLRNDADVRIIEQDGITTVSSLPAHDPT